VIGFVDLGGFNEQLADLEGRSSTDFEHAPVATHVLALMVRGLFLTLNFLYSTKKLTADNNNVHNHLGSNWKARAYGVQSHCSHWRW
jgi:hypothetical protein